jgi:hypothetical protein
LDPKKPKKTEKNDKFRTQSQEKSKLMPVIDKKSKNRVKSGNSNHKISPSIIM